MQPKRVNSITAPFLANDIFGSICVALALFILKLWAEMKNEWAAHKVELAAKDALIEKLFDARIAEARIGFEIIKANERSLDAIRLLMPNWLVNWTRVAYRGSSDMWVSIAVFSFTFSPAQSAAARHGGKNGVAMQRPQALAEPYDGIAKAID